MIDDRPSVADIKALLVSGPDFEGLIGELCPDGAKKGHYWSARSPLRADRHGGSFVVWLKGAPGAWKDYASDEAGDILDLIAYVKFGGRDRDARVKAIQWAKARLGLAASSPAEVARDLAAARARQRAEAEKAERAAADKRRRAFDLWLSGQPVGGTLGEVYLRARGLDVRAVPNIETSMRFKPAVDYWKPGAPPHRGPAILSLFRDARGAGVAVHGTWLTQDGRDKADLSPAKLVFGAYAGAMVRLTKGASGLTCEEAAQQGVAEPVVLTEGLEDGWSSALARPDLRHWMMGSLSNLGNAPRLPCVSAFYVWRDNDWGKPAAVEAFERAMDKLRATGAPAIEITPPCGKDPNDTLRGKK